MEETFIIPRHVHLWCSPSPVMRHSAVCHTKFPSTGEGGGPGREEEGGSQERLTGWKELPSLRQTHSDQGGVASRGRDKGTSHHPYAQMVPFPVCGPTRSQLGGRGVRCTGPTITWVHVSRTLNWNFYPWSQERTIICE